MKYSNITLSVILFFLFSCNSSLEDSESISNSNIVASEPVIEYGFDTDTFLVIKNDIQSGQSLGKYLVIIMFHMLKLIKSLAKL